eukprot:scaffold12194_cov93-Isochrysis_galbana.AAC.1
MMCIDTSHIALVIRHAHAKHALLTREIARACAIVPAWSSRRRCLNGPTSSRALELPGRPLSKRPVE